MQMHEACKLRPLGYISCNAGQAETGLITAAVKQRERENVEFAGYTAHRYTGEDNPPAADVFRIEAKELDKSKGFTI